MIVRGMCDFCGCSAQVVRSEATEGVQICEGCADAAIGAFLTAASKKAAKPKRKKARS